MNDEQVIWKGRPSQLLNFWTFVACAALAGLAIGGAFWILPIAIAAILPLGWAIWRFLVVRCRIYELTSQRLRLYEGVLNQEIDEIELYRVKDTTIQRPFILRLFQLADIALKTSDRSHPNVAMRAIQDGVTVREHIRKHVELIRDQKRVREVDFDTAGDGDGGADGDDMDFGDQIG